MPDMQSIRGCSPVVIGNSNIVVVVVVVVVIDIVLVVLQWVEVCIDTTRGEVLPTTYTKMSFSSKINFVNKIGTKGSTDPDN